MRRKAELTELLASGFLWTNICFPTSQKRDVGHPVFVLGWRVRFLLSRPFAESAKGWGNGGMGANSCGLHW